MQGNANPNRVGRAARFYGAAALLCGLAAAPGWAQSTLAILGSSTAFGTGATNKDSSWAGRYAAALKDRSSRMPWNVVNLAVGGYTTFHILPTGTRSPSDRPAPDTARNITKALNLRPKPLALIVNMPSNDAASGYSAAQQKANYDTLAAVAARAGIPIWICSPQPRTGLIGDAQKKAAHLEVRDWVFTRFGERSVDFWAGLARPDAGIDASYDAGDGIHLNDRGHKALFDRMIAERIPEFLETPTALTRTAAARTPQGLAAGLLAPGFPFDARGRSLP